jgi:hypothetical protein
MGNVIFKRRKRKVKEKKKIVIDELHHHRAHLSSLKKKRVTLHLMTHEYFLARGVALAAGKA